MIVLDLFMVLVFGLAFGYLSVKLKLPKLIGMILIGILIGPSFLNIISANFIKIAPILRQVALVIILTRSGLSLNIQKLKEVGRPAILLSVIPATLEIIGVLILGPLLLKISIIESLLLGSVLAAVSPAIIVPRMINLEEEGYGTNKKIPSIIMGASSVDDIYVIILFYLFLPIASGNNLSTFSIISIPLSIILGILFGIVIGLIISYLFKKLNIHLIIKSLMLLVISLAILFIEPLTVNFLPYSALLSILTIGIVVYSKQKDQAVQIEKNYKMLWFVFEIILFVSLGISVDITYAIKAGILPVVVIILALLFRTLGVYISLLATKLSKKEKLFVSLSYLPKATVQASIGAIALSSGLAVGSLILTSSVLAILITAPLGAILIDRTYKILLEKEVDTYDAIN